MKKENKKMTNATKELSEEHENILKVIAALEEETEKTDEIEKGELNKEFFIKATGFIRNYADKFHHAKEEDILFKEFIKAAEEGCVHCNPVEQMLFEHGQGREFVKGMEQGLNENNKNKIIENAKGYCQLLKEHIFKEDNILYPMAEQALNEKKKKEIIKKFEEIAKEKNKEVKANLKFAKSLK